MGVKRILRAELSWGRCVQGGDQQIRCVYDNVKRSQSDLLKPQVRVYDSFFF